MNIRELNAIRRARRMIEWIEKTFSVKLDRWQREAIEKEYLAEVKRPKERDRLQTEGAGMSAAAYTVDENPGWAWAPVNAQKISGQRVAAFPIQGNGLFYGGNAYLEKSWPEIIPPPSRRE